MKRIYAYVIAGITLFATSCGDDFLKIDHYDILEPSVLFSNEATIIQGLNGVYDMFYPEWQNTRLKKNVIQHTLTTNAKYQMCLTESIK